MTTFEVKDMTCGHCASTITKALKAIDPQAKVTIDLAPHLVMVESTHADGDALEAAIAEAGYTPMAIKSDATNRQRPGGRFGNPIVKHAE